MLCSMFSTRLPLLPSPLPRLPYPLFMIIMQITHLVTQIAWMQLGATALLVRVHYLPSPRSLLPTSVALANPNTPISTVQSVCYLLPPYSFAFFFSSSFSPSNSPSLYCSVCMPSPTPILLIILFPLLLLLPLQLPFAPPLPLLLSLPLSPSLPFLSPHLSSSDHDCGGNCTQNELCRDRGLGFQCYCIPGFKYQNSSICTGKYKRRKEKKEKREREEEGGEEGEGEERESYCCFFMTDVDECKTGLHNCSILASCNNTIGAFNCTCNPGYTGDGVTCSGNGMKEARGRG